MRKSWLLIYFLVFVVSANPLQGLTKLGAGDMSFMWWDLYHAEFYADQLPYKPNQWPQALKLSYQRDITQDDLISATKDQWRHLKLQNPQQDLWLTQLAEIWPDIQKDDELILLVDGDGVSHFYFNKQLIGSIKQPEFGSAFLAIWLSDNTSEPKLRKKLLGIKP